MKHNDHTVLLISSQYAKHSFDFFLQNWKVGHGGRTVQLQANCVWLNCPGTAMTAVHFRFIHVGGL